MEAPKELAHTLLPLALACEVVYEKVYAYPPNGLSREEVLNSIAGTIATVAPIYEHSSSLETGLRQVSAAELAGGAFKRGGKELAFPDGRKARLSLAVNAEDIAAVVARLKPSSNRSIER